MTQPSDGRGRTTTTRPSHVLPKVVWLNMGVVGTEPWSDAHLRAAQSVATRFRGRVVTDFIDGVLPSDVRRTIDRVVAEGADLIFATSAPLADEVARAARRHPDVRFEQARGSQVLGNLATYGGADEEALYLAGMAAAGSSTTKVIGFVATVPEPETVRHIDAFTLGARAVSSDAEVRVRWLGAWYDLEGERRLARGLVGEGADVIATGSISPATGEVAREAQVGWVAHDADRSEAYGDVWITSAVPDWSSYYQARVAALLAHTWRAGAYYGSMADSFTDIAPLGRRVPDPIRLRVQATRRRLKDGTFDIFAGPIVDQSGTVRVPAGGTLAVPDRLRLDWFVAGVDGDPAGG